MRNKKTDHGKIVGLRLDATVAKMLEDLADREGLTEQATMRLLIRRSHAARVKK